MSALKSYNMGVMARDANGAPDFFFCAVQATSAEYDDGGHYEKAMELARAQGYEPMMAFDEHDPAWRPMRELAQHRGFVADAVETLIDTVAPGREAGGADTVEWAGELLRRAFSGTTPVCPTLYFAASADGFWNNADGWCGTAQEAFLTPNQARFAGLGGQCVTVVSVPARLIDSLQDLPSIDDIQDAAAEVLNSAAAVGTMLDKATATQAMREALAAARGASLDPSKPLRDDDQRLPRPRPQASVIPDVLDPFLGEYLLGLQDEQRQTSRERGT